MGQRRAKTNATLVRSTTRHRGSCNRYNDNGVFGAQTTYFT
jgi:hypothetical protein